MLLGDSEALRNLLNLSNNRFITLVRHTDVIKAL